MRVTTKAVYTEFNRNLSDIQLRRSIGQMKLTTGKDIINLSDAPDKVVDTKRFTDKIQQNEKYQSVVEESLREMYSVDEELRVMADYIQEIRQIAIDGTPVGIDGNVSAVGFKIKGMLEDIIKEANVDFNGHFLFSGTQTTTKSIELNQNQPGVEKGSNNMPFEIVQEAGTPENPSGLRVIYKGNFEERVFNKDPKTTEVLNITPDDMFGEGATEIFPTIVELFNVMSYKADGSPRMQPDFLNKEEINKINGLQAKLAQYYDNINAAAAKNGTRLQRLESISEQMANENVRLKDYRSFKEDADVAQVAMDLKREETALEYALQVGARINQSSLFDFLR